MFFPEAIDLSESEKYILVIRLQGKHFSFAIHQPGRNDAYIYRSTVFSEKSPYLQQVQRTIFNLNFLTQPYLQTWVEIVSPHYTLVPSEFYDSKAKENYLTKAFFGEQQGHILSETVGLETDQQLIFDVDMDLYDFLSRSLFSPTFTHHTKSLHRLFTMNSGNTELFSRVHLYFSEDQTDVLVTKNGKIQTIQSFTNQSEQDLLYFVMNLWKTLDLDQMNDRLFLSGSSEKYAKLTPLLSKFIQYVEQKGAPSEAFLLGEDAVKTPIDLFPLLL